MKLTARFFFTLITLFAAGLLLAQVDSFFAGKQLLNRSNIPVTTAATGMAKKIDANVLRVTIPKSRLSAQSDCGVHASFTPEGDSTFSSNLGVLFTSTSTNATSVQWLVDGSNYSNDPTFRMWFSTVGLHEIKLVAKNGNCTDTAVAYYLLTGNIPPYDRPALLSQYGFHFSDDFSTAMCTLKDGSYLLGGYSVVYNSQEGDRGLLIKVKPGGCVEWTRFFQGGNGRVSNVRALKDSGFLVAVSGLNAAIYRMDSKGNVKWKFTYKTGNQALTFRVLNELSDGSIIAGAGDGGFDGFYLHKLAASGSLIWNKYYMKSSYDFAMPIGVAELDGNIYVSGYINNPNQESQYNSEYNKDGFIVSVNKATGATNWSKSYGAIGFSDFFQDLHVYGNNLLVNDMRTNYLGGANVKQAFHFIGTDGAILKSSKVVNTAVMGSPFFTQIVPLSDGRLYLAQSGYEAISLQPGFIMHSNWQKIDTSNHIYWQKIFSNYSRGYFQCIDTGKSEKLVSFGTDLGLLERRTYLSKNFQLVQMDSSGISDDFACTFYSSATTIIPDTITSVPLVWLKDSVLSYQVNAAPYMPNIAYSEVRYGCPDFVDSCTYIRLNGQQRLCNLSAIYEYRVNKSPGCFQPVEWDLPEGVEVITKTDSLLQLRFNGFGTYKIGALLDNECNPMKDSIFVIAKSSSSVLNLGSDTAICPGTSITLRAGKTFLTYQWQDNTTDSNLVVSTPGKYWVKVTDSCGNVLRDTVNVSLAEKLLIDIGPDRTKCNTDTLHINAPSGFINYTWSNNYNISSTTSQTVVVNPLVDTAYYIRAEKSPGCFAFDTVRVTVNHSPVIDLGRDKSFCSGDSAVFNAGTGFNQYLWSNGNTSRQITVTTPGTYSVTGTTTQGCKSYGTVKVLSVFANPVVRLDHNNALCTGSSRTLDAGPFSSYKWTDGSRFRTLSVNNLGVYAVEVQDVNGCKGSDTTVITEFLPLPENFLPADTAICSYGSLTLIPTHTYTGYLWSNNASASSITITQPGEYWLKVKDVNNCIGSDTIRVNPKDCMQGFYIPTAFTPNGDGKNDEFRPLLFGQVKKYSFTICNRWGQVVFQTSELAKGWNGIFAGTKQDSNVFAWTCTYQLEGQEVKTEKGTVMLIR